MRKIFSLLLLGLLCSIGTIKADAMSVTWSLEDGTAISGVSSNPSAAESMSWDKGSNIVYHSNYLFEGTTYSLFSNTTKKDNKRSAIADNYIEFSFTPVGGTFVPTSITFDAIKVGTGDPKLYVDMIIGSTTTVIADDVVIRKNSETEPSEHQSFDVSTKGFTASTDVVKLRIYIGKLSDNKQVGLANVVINGTYESSDAPDSAPAFTNDLPVTEEATVGVEKTLSVVVSGKPAPSFQWYSCTDAQKTGAQEIENANSNSYSFTPEATGTLYFYVVATNSVGSETSNVVAVSVSQAPAATPTFKVYGNTVQIACATDDATICYELDNANVKTSETKVQYNGAFIPAASGTIYAYATKEGFFDSEVASQTITLSTVGDVVGDLVVLVQPANHNDGTVTYNDITISSDGTLEASARGVYPNHFKASGTITLAAANGKIIKSIKIIGTSNDGSKVSTIAAGDGATVISTPAELMPRDVTVGGVQTVTEIVITADAPAANNSVSFTLGRESRFYVEVYGEGDFTITPASAKSTYVAKYALDFSGVAGLAAYVASSASDDAVSLTQVTTVPVGTPLILVGTAGTEYVVPIVASAAAPAANLLVAGAGEAVSGADKYVLSIQSEQYVFASLSESSATVPVGKAYLDLSGLNAAPVLRIVEGENNATNIETLNASEKAVKFIQNGQLFIQKDGVVYTATGAVVK